MTDLLDFDRVALCLELHAVVARTDAVASGQLTPQRLCPTDGRPLLQSLEKAGKSRLDEPWQPLKLLRRHRRNDYFGHHTSLARIDIRVNAFSSHDKSCAAPKTLSATPV